MKSISPFKIILGEEIKTSNGEIIGLFLNKKIEPYLSLEETIEEIRNQGGIVYIPHPFDFFRRCSFKIDKNFWKYIHIIEVFNSRTILPSDNFKSLIYAKTLKKIFGAGSDFHTKFEIGNCIIEMEDFNSEKEFLINLRKGNIFGKRANLLYHVITKTIKTLKLVL